jgi:hypothetical protein
MALWRAATQRFQAACMVIPIPTQFHVKDRRFHSP